MACGLRSGTDRRDSTPDQHGTSEPKQKGLPFHYFFFQFGVLVTQVTVVLTKERDTASNEAKTPRELPSGRL